MKQTAFVLHVFQNNSFSRMLLSFFLMMTFTAVVKAQSFDYGDPVPPPGAYQTLASRIASSENPNIPTDLLCQDLRVIFVLDESGSIAISGATQAVKDGVSTLGNALLNSGATLQIIEFSTTSSVVNLGLNTVNETYLSRLNDYLGAGYNGQNYNPVGATNWDDALRDVEVSPADLVIFFTDGFPTAYIGPDGNPIVQGGAATFQAALDAAVTRANIVKSQGKHMFVVGVGPGIDLPNIQAISGPDRFGGPVSVLTADFTTPPYEELAANLAAAVNAICGTELTVNKTASNSGVCAGETVTLTTTVTNTGGSFNFEAKNLNISDFYPDGYSNLEILSPDSGATIVGGNTVSYSLPALASGQSVTIVVRAVVDIPPGNYNNVVTATAFNANTVRDSVSVISGFATSELPISSCSPVVVNGQTYSSSGTYTQTLVSAAGCDSVLTIRFTLNPATTSNTEVTACDSYRWNNTTYTSSGRYSFQTLNANGCDSTAFLDLTINQSAATSFSASACDSYQWNGQTYTQSGTFVQTLKTVANCDSVVTLLLTINNSATSSFSATACGSYVWNDQTYTQSGTYVQTLKTIAGCDSVVTLDLTVNSDSKTEETVSVCNSYTWNGTTYTNSGTYTFVSTNAAGCRNTATLFLDIKRAPQLDAISGPLRVCRNKTFVYSVAPVANATSYTWTLPYGASGTSTSNTIHVTFNGCFSSGIIRVRANNECGAGTPVQICVNVFTSVPSVPGSVTGSSSICSPGNYTYSVAPVSGATSYSWTVSGTGLSIVSGQGTNSVVVAVSSAFQCGYLSVRSVNCLGSSCFARTVSINRSNPPAIPGNISGSPSVRKSDRSVCYTVSPVIGATSYSWSVTGGARISGPSTGLSVNVDFSQSTASSVVLSVRAVNSCGTSGASSRTISVNLACRPVSGKNNGIPVTSFSDDYRVFPNPSNGRFQVNIPGFVQQPLLVVLTNAEGKMVYRREYRNNEYSRLLTVSATGLAQGAYTLSVFAGKVLMESAQVFIQ